MVVAGRVAGWPPRSHTRDRRLRRASFRRLPGAVLSVEMSARYLVPAPDRPYVGGGERAAKPGPGSSAHAHIGRAVFEVGWTVEASDARSRRPSPRRPRADTRGLVPRGTRAAAMPPSPRRDPCHCCVTWGKSTRFDGGQCRSRRSRSTVFDHVLIVVNNFAALAPYSNRQMVRAEIRFRPGY